MSKKKMEKVSDREQTRFRCRSRHCLISNREGLGTSLSIMGLATINQQREQGWCSCESPRFPPMWPGFDCRTRRHMWVEFVVGSLLCSERFFSGYSSFPLSSKTNISKFQFYPGMHGHFWTSSCEVLVAPWVNKLHPFFWSERAHRDSQDSQVWC